MKKHSDGKNFNFVPHYPSYRCFDPTCMSTLCCRHVPLFYLRSKVNVSLINAFNKHLLITFYVSVTELDFYVRNYEQVSYSLTLKVYSIMKYTCR